MARNLLKILFQSYGILAFVFCLAIAFSDQLTSHPSTSRKWDLSQSWFVSPAQAQTLIEKGAVLLDARSIEDRIFKSLPNAKHVSWEEFAVTSHPLKGKLLPKEKVESKWSALGLKKEDTILVVGDPLSGWGEEGRIVWTLRSSDYHHSYIVDGGAHPLSEQLKQKKASVQNTEATKAKFEKSSPSQIDIDAESLRNLIKSSDRYVSILDVREEREYNGSTPYGETRGGHIPGARWLYYKELLDKDGFIKSKKEITDLLISRGYSNGNQIVSYCTGGVRSAFTTSVFLTYGLSAQNYSGSMWEWSSKDAKFYPVEKGKE